MFRRSEGLSLDSARGGLLCRCQDVVQEVRAQVERIEDLPQPCVRPVACDGVNGQFQLS